MKTDVLSSLARLHEKGALEAIDVELARVLTRLDGRGDDRIALATSLASAHVGAGDACVDLDHLEAGGALPGAEELIRLVQEAGGVTALRDALGSSPVATAPGGFAPLVLDPSGRLYLHRYWNYERTTAERLLARAGEPDDVVDPGLLEDGLDRMIGASSEAAGQRRAAATAVTRRLCVISGGPGTGKTTTVVAILALLVEQWNAARDSDPSARPPRIRLAAPTGKAAARMQEAVRIAKRNLEGRVQPAVLGAIPESAATIHRLLGPMRNRVGFRHDARNPLPIDALVVDEASMVDLALISRLLRALPDTARLILLGDKDQLASVEAGAVLGDICAGPHAPAPESADAPTARPPATAPASPLRDSIVLLEHSFRFVTNSGIGELATEVNRGNASGALRLLDDGGLTDIARVEVTTAPVLRARLATAVVDGYRETMERVREHSRGGAAAADVFAAFGRFRVLCGVRQGPFGVEAVNETIATLLDEAGLIRRSGDWYAGRPVMITRNDYQLRLFNGDVGIALIDRRSDVPRLLVHFEPSEGRERVFPPVRLPQHETVYAMTIHKSQGSEFERVLLLLPAERSRVLGRELLYTGITRARARVEVWGSEKSFREAVATPVRRASGLRDALWGARG